MSFIRLLLLSLSFCLAGQAELRAQSPAAETAQPAEITQLLRLLDDEGVKAWLKQKQADVPESTGEQRTSQIEKWEAHARSRLNGLVAAVPRVSDELFRAGAAVRQDARQGGFAPAMLMFGFIAGIALGVEWLFRRSVRKTASPDFLLQQVYAEFGALSIFTGAVTALFLLFAWPPLVSAVVLYSLIALIAFRIVDALCRLGRAASVLSAQSSSRIRIFTAGLIIAIAFLALSERLSVTTDVRSVLAIGFSVPLLAIVIEVIWHRHSSEMQPLQRRVSRAIGIASAVLIWLFWCGGFLALFWLGVMAFFVPRALSLIDRLAPDYLLSDPHGESSPTLKSVVVVRGARAIVIIAAVDWVAFVWRHNFPVVSDQAPLAQTIIAGAFNSVIILLIIDFIWQLAKAYIARKLHDSDTEDALTTTDLARHSRLRTLLPVLRNTLAAGLVCIAALTVLSQMGVEIGPLIAGAGVVGVAIGFGSQTLVKDVVSGIFYLLDDAFRVGEYIEAGSYTGVVESFSLRSVRLRHHRGSIFTIPFGSLGAIRNTSRDWTIDKFRIRVPFKTDLDKVRKLVKNIGGQLLEDPEHGPSFIEPLKLKGVEQIGEYGVELGVAFKCKPGGQTMIRRKAYTMLMQAFRDNGIDFAQPIVQVNGDDKDTGAAALAVRQRQNAATTPGSS